jgi:hypothetical protein
MDPIPATATMPGKKTKPVKKAARQPAGGKKAAAPKKRAAAARSRTPAGRRARGATRRSVGPTKIAGSPGGVNSEDIALQAYYLAERRRHLGLPGNPESDWLEAERLLRR